MVSVMKTCTRCGETKPLDAFYPRGTGYRSACKECTRAEQNARNAEKRRIRDEKRAAELLRNPPPPPPTSKRCTKCGIVKPLKKFYPEKRNRRDGRRAYCKSCKARSAREGDARRSARTDEQIAADRLRLRPSGRKSCRKCRRSLEFAAFPASRARADGLQDFCFACSNRGLLDIAEPYWATHGIDPDICAWCGAPSEHVDHIQPLALGGTDDPRNLIPACAPCNHSKNARPTHVWINEYVDPANEDAWLLDQHALDGAAVIDPAPSVPITGPAVAFAQTTITV